MDTKPMEFTAATIYAPHLMLGYIVRIDAKWARFWVAPYAQHDECVFGEYVRLGKRTIETLLGCDFYVVVVSTQEAIEPTDCYLPPVDNIRQLRYTAGDSRWKSDFDEQLRAAGVSTLADYRKQTSDIAHDKFFVAASESSGDQFQTPSSDAMGVASTDQVSEFEEGNRYQAERFFFHRNRQLIEEAKRVLGYVCQVCGFDFADAYGSLGTTFIEMHHLNPLSERPQKEWSTDVMTNVADVAVLCANCHRMVHRRKPALSIEQLKALLIKGPA